MAIGDALAGMAGPAIAGAVGPWILDKVSKGLVELSKAGNMAMKPIRELTESLTTFLLAPIKSVQALGAAISPLVALFNPAYVIQFELALRDTMAVLGQMLVPVLEGITIYIQKFGDALVGLTPVFQPLFDEIGQLITSIASMLVPMAKAAAPVLQGLAEVLGRFLKILAQGVAFFTGVVIGLLNVITKMFGLTSNFKEGSSSNFAFRPTKVQSVEQFSNDVFESSARNIYSRGTEAKKPEALLAEIKDAMENGRKLVEKIEKHVSAILAWFKRRGQEIDKIGDAGGIASGAASVGGGIGYAIGKLGFKKSW